jgi:hypothetical protein
VAANFGVPIVSLAWLEACLEKGELLDPTEYRIPPLTGLVISATGFSAGNDHAFANPARFHGAGRLPPTDHSPFRGEVLPCHARSLPDLIRIPGPTACDVSAEEKGELARVVSSLGGKYTADMTQDVTTHLIAKSAEGMKYMYAKDWRVTVVTRKWLEECDRTKGACPANGGLPARSGPHGTGSLPNHDPCDILKHQTVFFPA